MKKQLKSTLLIATIGILFPSCSNLSKISLTKRHYRRGYYVELGNKTNALPISPTTSRLIIKPRNQISFPAIAAKPKEPILANTEKVSKEKINSVQKIVITQKEIQQADENMNNSSLPKLSVENNLTQAYRNSQAGEVRAEVNVNVSYALIIICAIFIPPLGVGLMYGINSYFWIDLILTLLFFFPGMIFALIVVLM
jgi:uncharacterized membrane protein YqaE (UPF0057 family)